MSCETLSENASRSRRLGPEVVPQPADWWETTLPGQRAAAMLRACRAITPDDTVAVDMHRVLEWICTQWSPPGFVEDDYRAAQYVVSCANINTRFYLRGERTREQFLTRLAQIERDITATQD